MQAVDNGAVALDTGIKKAFLCNFQERLCLLYVRFESKSELDDNIPRRIASPLNS